MHDMVRRIGASAAAAQLQLIATPTACQRLNPQKLSALNNISFVFFRTEYAMGAAPIAISVEKKTKDTVVR
eukprot:SAG31_NODE_2_length_46263_cov_45.908043_24_plen_71_part_00